MKMLYNFYHLRIIKYFPSSHAFTDARATRHTSDSLKLRIMLAWREAKSRCVGSGADNEKH